MRRIVNGKVYDTETADWIANYEYRHRGDFHWYAEDLYRTKKGTFFLAGEGGGLSKYQVEVGCRSWCGGSKIIVLTEEEAREWVEKYGSTRLYEKLFDVEEG